MEVSEAMANDQFCSEDINELFLYRERLSEDEKRLLDTETKRIADMFLRWKQARPDIWSGQNSKRTQIKFSTLSEVLYSDTDYTSDSDSVTGSGFSDGDDLLQEVPEMATGLGLPDECEESGAVHL